jgi:hypothetical protein
MGLSLPNRIVTGAAEAFPIIPNVPEVRPAPSATPFKASRREILLTA